MNGPNKLECLSVTGNAFRPSVIQHSSLLVSFVSYEENKVLGYSSRSPIANVPSKLFEPGVMFAGKARRLPFRYKHFSLLGPLASYEENRVW